MIAQNRKAREEPFDLPALVAASNLAAVDVVRLSAQRAFNKTGAEIQLPEEIQMEIGVRVKAPPALAENSAVFIVGVQCVWTAPDGSLLARAQVDFRLS